jgi:hypothetical protein
LDALPQPKPELPDFDFTPALTAPLGELLDLHGRYAEKVTAAVREAGSVARIDDVEETSSDLGENKQSKGPGTSNETP